MPGKVVILWGIAFALVLSLSDLFCHRFSLTQVRGLWRRKHANQAEHEKAPSKRGSIAPNEERSKSGPAPWSHPGPQRLKPMVIIHRVLAGEVRSTTSCSLQFLVSHGLQFKSLISHLLSPTKGLIRASFIQAAPSS